VPEPAATTAPEPIRDALGLVRVLFLAARDEGHHGRIVATTEAGKALRQALAFSRLEPSTLGARSIPSHVARAFAALERAPWPPEVLLLVRIAKARAGSRDAPTLAPSPAA
jgi:hypothetical protein